MNIKTNKGTVIIAQDAQKEIQNLVEIKKLNDELQQKMQDIKIFQTPSEDELLEKVKEVKEEVDKNL